MDLLQRNCEIGEANRQTLSRSIQFRFRRFDHRIQVSRPVVIEKSGPISARSQGREACLFVSESNDVIETLAQAEFAALDCSPRRHVCPAGIFHQLSGSSDELIETRFGGIRGRPLLVLNLASTVDAYGHGELVIAYERKVSIVQKSAVRCHREANVQLTAECFA